MEVAIAGESFQLALKAVADDEINTAAPDVRQVLQRSSPKTFTDLIDLLRSTGFALRPINGVGAHLPASSPEFPEIFPKLFAPCAREVARRDPPVTRLQTPRHNLAPDDYGSELVDANGYGIFDSTTFGEPHDPIEPGELVGPMCARQKRDRLIDALERSFCTAGVPQAHLARVQRALAVLRESNAKAWEVEAAQDLATHTLVRETAVALEPIGIRLAEHRRFIYVHVARLMELADLVTQPDQQSDDPDGARYERVRKALQRHTRQLEHTST